MTERITSYCREPTDEELAAVPLIPSILGDNADLEEAWKFFAWMEACDWKHLPAAGGLEDQDDVLMENIFRIKQAVQKVKK